MDLVVAFAQGYLRALEHYPVSVKAVTAAWAMCFADLLSQRIEHKFSTPETPKEINWGRVLRVVMFATVFGTPVLHYYYIGLEFLFPGDSSQSIFAKICCDLFVFTPISIFAFFVGLGFLEGQSMSKIQAELEANYFSTLKAGLTLWPLASLINFWLIPVNFRLFFTGAVSLAWNSYLSFVKATAGNTEEPLPTNNKPLGATPTLKKIFPFPGKVSVT